MKRQLCTSKNWIFLDYESPRLTRQQSYRLESFVMKTDTLVNGSTVKKPHRIENGFRIQCNTENFVPIVVPGLSSSSSSNFPSSTSMTPSRQEIDHPTSSSSSSTSPTTTVSSDSETRAREDPSGIDSHPAPVSSKHVEREERRNLLTKPTKNPKPNKKRRPRFRTERPASFRLTGMAARIPRKCRG